MAEALYLVSRSASVGVRTVNGVQAVLINNDDGDADSLIIAAATAAANSSSQGGAADPFDAEYFDTVSKVSDLSAGALKDDGDAFIFGPFAPVKVEGS